MRVLHLNEILYTHRKHLLVLKVQNWELSDAASILGHAAAGFVPNGEEQRSKIYLYKRAFHF